MMKNQFKVLRCFCGKEGKGIVWRKRFSHGTSRSWACSNGSYKSGWDCKQCEGNTCTKCPIERNAMTFSLFLYNGRTVCDDYFDINAANAICHLMGRAVTQPVSWIMDVIEDHLSPQTYSTLLVVSVILTRR